MPDLRDGTPPSDRVYRLVMEIVYEAPSDDDAGLLATEFVAMPLENEEAVWETEGDFYFEASSDPLNRSTIRMTAE
jgi:hypothetical protein